jgi:hypothetical protein
MRSDIDKPSVYEMFVEHNGANWWHHGYRQWSETKCPDLGDWSDTPHDQLDDLWDGNRLYRWYLNRTTGVKNEQIQQTRKRIELDRERLLGYIED